MIIKLTLGEITFANTEIPSTINFGGAQSLSTKKLIGGRRIIDALGRDDDDITWSGLFFGSTASFRAKFLDSYRIQGVPLPLSWSQFNYLVVIKEFKANFERFYQIPYSLTVTVIQDLNNPINVLLPVGYNDVIISEMILAMDLASVLANPSITSALSVLSIALNSIPDLSNASLQQISSLFIPLGGALSAITAAITVSTNSLQLNSVTGSRSSQDEDNPEVVSANMLELARLYDLESLLINLGENLDLIRSGSQGSTIAVQNANLYRLAAKNYSDATQWTTIASANGLRSPYQSGGIVSSVVVENGGSGYINPSVTAVGDYTYIANLQAIVIDGVIVGIRIVSSGLYDRRPNIVITDTQGTGASAVAICTQYLTIPQQTTGLTGGILIA